MEIQFPPSTDVQRPPVTDKKVKTIKMVDLVGKKHCSVMVEVNFAPAKRITQEEMDKSEFLITWEDGSQARYQLVDLFRFTLNKYVSCITWLSHGMDFFDYVTWLKEKYPDLNGDTQMAGYYYKKVSR